MSAHTLIQVSHLKCTLDVIFLGLFLMLDTDLILLSFHHKKNFLFEKHEYSFLLYDMKKL